MASSQVIFLSHSGADTEGARDLKRRLLASPEAREKGLKVWFDKDALKPGQWQAQIEQAINADATAFVVYVGSSGVILVNYERAGAVQTGTVAQ